ncbi:MAG: DUF3592 domain-containing protein [Candidatus Omnitrophica bacterium]|jgi:hypothetical protein|nr:DUF3592 domain-containing protein [Candidatus Omnitrophota bacterium]
MFYFILVFGLVWVFGMLYVIIMGLRSKSWPLTTGKIVSSEVRKQVSRARGNRPNPASYQPYVLYEYSVGGNRMQSEQLAFGGRMQVSEKRAQKIIENYPAGKNIPVYYNPQKHTQSVLIAGNVIGVYIMLAFGFVFIALGVAGIALKW